MNYKITKHALQLHGNFTKYQIGYNKLLYQCQLLTLVASGRSSTSHRGSPSPHFAILQNINTETVLINIQ